MKVLEILGSLHRGGAETMVMNYYRAFDKSLCQMDFVIHAEFEGDYRAEAESMGARIILLPTPGQTGALHYIRLLTKAIKENGPYDAVHIHTNYQAFLGVIAAWKIGVKNVIVHSHTTSFKKTHLLVNRIVFACGNVVRLACGKKAGDAFFGKRSYTVINNAIPVSKFVQSSSESMQIESEKAKVIGHLGSFSFPKNHEFIVALAECLKKRKLGTEIRLFGEGELEQSIRQLVIDRNVQDYIKFMGVTNDVVAAYRTFSVFILPSRYEGFPVTLVEAQLAGVSSLASEQISKECDLELGLLDYLPLDVNIWADKIAWMLEENVQRGGAMDNDVIEKYDVAVQWKKLLSVYEGKQNENSILYR